jgi:hypothetical protein
MRQVKQRKKAVRDQECRAVKVPRLPDWLFRDTLLFPGQSEGWEFPQSRNNGAISS